MCNPRVLVSQHLFLVQCLLLCPVVQSLTVRYFLPVRRALHSDEGCSDAFLFDGRAIWPSDA